MSLPDKVPTKKQLVEVDIASLAIGELPKTYFEYGELIWKAFYLGRKHKELEVIDHDPLEPIREVYEKWKYDVTSDLLVNGDRVIFDLWQAIKKAMEAK